MSRYNLEWSYPCLEDGTRCWFVIELERLDDQSLSYLNEGILPIKSRENDNELTEYMLQKLAESEPTLDPI